MAGVRVVIRGVMTRAGLHVGGGPMPPGEGGGAPGEPPGIWGGVPPEYVDIGLPGPQPTPPGIWGGGNEGFPTHPIVIPPEFIADVHPEHPIVIPPPPGIWGGGNAGFPEHPIVIPPDLDIWGPTDPRPTHPIVVPPPTPTVPPQPTHPIVMPPEGPPEVLDKWDVVAYWTPAGGWAMAIVPGEGHDAPIVTPSAAARSGS
jgi:hypothetical protein